MKRDKRSEWDWSGAPSGIITYAISKDELRPTIELLTRLVGHYFEPQIAHYRIVNEIARLKTLLGEKGEK